MAAAKPRPRPSSAPGLSKTEQRTLDGLLTDGHDLPAQPEVDPPAQPEVQLVPSPGSKSGYKHVRQMGRKWGADTADHKYLGVFKTAEDAARAISEDAIRRNLRWNNDRGSKVSENLKIKEELVKHDPSLVLVTSKTNCSGYVGVFQVYNRFQARPQFGTTKSNLGTYNTAEEAAKAIAMMAKRLGIPWKQPTHYDDNNDID